MCQSTRTLQTFLFWSRPICWIKFNPKIHTESMIMSSNQEPAIVTCIYTHTFCIYTCTYLPYVYVIMCYSTCVLLSYLPSKQMSTTFLTWNHFVSGLVPDVSSFFSSPAGTNGETGPGTGISLSCSSLSPKLISSQTFLATHVDHCRPHPKKVLQ